MTTTYHPAPEQKETAPRDSTTPLTSLAELIAEVISNTLQGDKTENGDEETCSSPERMAPQQHH